MFHLGALGFHGHNKFGRSLGKLPTSPGAVTTASAFPRATPGYSQSIHSLSGQSGELEACAKFPPERAIGQAPPRELVMVPQIDEPRPDRLSPVVVI